MINLRQIYMHFLCVLCGLCGCKYLVFSLLFTTTEPTENTEGD